MWEKNNNRLHLCLRSLDRRGKVTKTVMRYFVQQFTPVPLSTDSGKTNNDFIFVELAHKKIALFYFYKRLFEDEIVAKAAAEEAIKKFY